MSVVDKFLKQKKHVRVYMSQHSLQLQCNGYSGLEAVDVIWSLDCHFYSEQTYPISQFKTTI